MSAVGLRVAARSDVGLVRSSNQDSGYAGPHLLVLADGMGGPAGGDIASSVAVAHLAPLDEESLPADELLPRLRQAVEGAHRELIQRAQRDPDLAGLGTTCIAVLRTGNKLAMVHIGDSRAYLLRGGQLSQVTTDHTFVQYLVDSGRLTSEEAVHHPQRNVIMRALGDSEGEVELDESMREARLGDRWLLASDGLFGVVSAETIAHALTSIDDPDACAEALVDLSLRGGAPDNVTCVVADVVSATDPQRSPALHPIVVGSAAKERAKHSRREHPVAGGREDAAADAEDDPERGFRSWGRGRIFAVTALVVALLVASLSYVGYRWTQTQYFVAESDGYVAIYQGIPQEIGPLSLASLHERTSLRVDSLRPVAQQRLTETITRPSLEDAQAAVTILREEHVAEPPEDATEAEPAAEPAADPAGDPAGQPGTTPDETTQAPGGAG